MTVYRTKDPDLSNSLYTDPFTISIQDSFTDTADGRGFCRAASVWLKVEVVDPSLGIQQPKQPGCYAVNALTRPGPVSK